MRDLLRRLAFAVLMTRQGCSPKLAAEYAAHFPPQGEARCVYSKVVEAEVTRVSKHSMRDGRGRLFESELTFEQRLAPVLNELTETVLRHGVLTELDLVEG